MNPAPMNKDFQRIMLVDDEEDHHLITRMVLRKAGFSGNLMAYLDPADAISALKSMDELPDLILLDINMPGTTGFGLIQRCEAEHLLPNGRTMVVMCSSSNRPVDIETARRSRSVDDYVEKSFDLDQYERLMHQFNTKHEQSQPLP